MSTALITPESPQESTAALRDFFAMVKARGARAEQAREDLERHTATLIDAIRTGSGQGQRVAHIALSCWNGLNLVGLCDDLCGLDHAIAEAVLALIAARLFLGGDADDLIRPILTDSGILPL